MPLIKSPGWVWGGKLFRVVVTSTSSLTKLVAGLQSPACARRGLRAPDGSTLLTAGPRSVAVAFPTTLAEAPAARPAGTLQVRLLPASAAQVAGACGVTWIFVRPAGKVSTRLILPVVGPVPLLLAVTVQVIASPTLTVVLSAVFVTATLGLITVLLVAQSD